MINLCSIHISRDVEEQLVLQDFITNKISKMGRNQVIMIGQDSNTQVGIAEIEVEEGGVDKNLDKFRLLKVDQKGIQLIEFIRNNNLIIANTFFKARIYITYKSFNKLGSKYQIDHIIILIDPMIENYQILLLRY